MASESSKNPPRAIDDATLARIMAAADFHPRLSIEGFPRIRCRFPANWDTGRHCLSFHLLYSIFNGSIAVETAASTIVAGPGDVVLIPLSTPFRAHSRGSAVRLARIRFTFSKRDRPLAWGKQPRLWKNVVGIEPVLAVAEDLLLRKLATAHEQQAIFILLYAALQRTATETLSPAQMETLRQLVRSDPTCTPADLATALGLTHDYATRIIRRGLGVPPRAFILRERLRLAADRLAAGNAPIDTATGLGWRDHKLFLRQFRTAYGLPPGRWLRHLA